MVPSLLWMPLCTAAYCPWPSFSLSSYVSAKGFRTSRGAAAAAAAELGAEEAAEDEEDATPAPLIRAAAAAASIGCGCGRDEGGTTGAAERGEGQGGAEQARARARGKGGHTRPTSPRVEREYHAPAALPTTWSLRTPSQARRKRSGRGARGGEKSSGRGWVCSGVVVVRRTKIAQNFCPLQKHHHRTLLPPTPAAAPSVLCTSARGSRLALAARPSLATSRVPSFRSAQKKWQSRATPSPSPPSPRPGSCSSWSTR
jgi:hypothetical protein